MCGIAGYFGSTLIDKETLEKTANVLFHRGPDGSGIYSKSYSEKSISMVHTRLKIIDLKKRSNQPFEYGHSTLVFNGEIYNYLELRKQLIELGHKFKTTGDTEVLIHALREWGPEKALKKLEGMWAFAWFDENKKQLVLARDRFGEKPLYIMEEKKGIFFSSEIKGISSLRGSWPKKNFNHLMRYLKHGYKSLYKVEETFFENVFEFPKGKLIIYNQNGSSKKINYWKLNFKKKNNYTQRENFENVKYLLINSLKLRTRSDVPFAFCLSSGIDSNSLISISKKILNLNVKGFSINSNDARYSEKNLIEKSLPEQDIKCLFIKTRKKNFFQNLKNLIIQHDSPISTISYYVQWNLLKHMRSKGYKVSISGTGADEIFSGYYDHHNLYLADVYRDKKLFDISLANWKKYQKKIIRNKHLLDPRLFINKPFFRNHIYQDKKNFDNFFLINWNEKFKEENYNCDHLRNRMLNELFNESVPVILHEDDHNAMSLSMENRSPFLDKELFEYSLSIPTEHLIQNGFGKNVLRQSMKNIVPDIILNQRKKIGFNASISEMISTGQKGNNDLLLNKSEIFDIVSRKKIEQLLEKKKFSNSESKFLFNFINSKLFMDNFVN